MVIFSLPEGYKGNIIIPFHVFLFYSLLHCHAKVQILYTVVCKKRHRVCCKHLHMYRCVYNTNIKESIRWDIYMGSVNKPRPWAMPTDSVCLLS